MGIKKIVIIGGGISGLAILHFLKKRFGKDAAVTLLERGSSTGGHIRSLREDGFLFETGPNGFLANQPATLELIDEIGLTDQLIPANLHAKRRYIQLNGKLHLVPSGPDSFFTTSLLSLGGKISMVAGLFKKDISKDQSIYEHTSKRFGREAAEHLFDPFVTGIFAGDVKRLHMASAFAKKLKPGAKMHSFKEGMGQLTARLFECYQDSISLNNSIEDIDHIQADKIILATPSYVTGKLLKVESFNQIHYAPVAVVGLAYKQKSFKVLPDGFGYLVASKEKKPILGVVAESNTFEGRAPDGFVTMRVIIGGRHHPYISEKTESALIDLAHEEINRSYGLSESAVKVFVKKWDRAIPQYELNYPSVRESIATSIALRPNICLTGNYLDGISLNDCINNAKSIAQTLTL